MLKEKCMKNYEMLAKPLRQEFSEPEIEQIYKVIKETPKLKLEFKIRGPCSTMEVEGERSLVQPSNRNKWTEILADHEYTLIANIYRMGSRLSDHMYCPKFPKPKDEGWFMTLGCIENGEVIAMKRVMYRSNTSSHQLVFNAPAKLGRLIYTLYLISDGYIGLDQQYQFNFDVVKSPKQNLENFDVSKKY